MEHQPQEIRGVRVCLEVGGGAPLKHTCINTHSGIHQAVDCEDVFNRNCLRFFLKNAFLALQKYGLRVNEPGLHANIRQRLDTPHRKHLTFTRLPITLNSKYPSFLGQGEVGSHQRTRDFHPDHAVLVHFLALTFVFHIPPCC